MKAFEIRETRSPTTGRMIVTVFTSAEEVLREVEVQGGGADICLTIDIDPEWEPRALDNDAEKV